MERINVKEFSYIPIALIDINMATLTFELIQPFWLCAPQTNEYASVVPLTYLLCCEGPLPPYAAVRGTVGPNCKSPPKM